MIYKTLEYELVYIFKVCMVTSWVIIEYECTDL